MAGKLCLHKNQNEDVNDGFKFKFQTLETAKMTINRSGDFLFTYLFLCIYSFVIQYISTTVSMPSSFSIPDLSCPANTLLLHFP